MKMREIKFRAWDMKKKQMLTIFDSSVGSDWYLPSWKENYKVMQYTGLTDKNGTEIYEGDIIECWSEGIKAQGKVIRRIDGLWIIYPAYQKKIMWGLCPNRNGKAKVEVVGNIYDNPELLKGQEE